MDHSILLKQLELHEGLRLKPYVDSVGKMTIGLGRNLTDKGITRTEALRMATRDILDVETDLNRNAPWWVRMTENRKLALADMCYNLGWTRLSKFRNFLDALEHERYDVAASEMLDSLWAGQVGQRAKTLSAMIRDG